MKPCKMHATYMGVQVWEPRPDGYCTDACRMLGLEARVTELEGALRDLLGGIGVTGFCRPSDKQLERARKVLG